MVKRIFIAINLPKEIKENLLQYRQKWPELPLRWSKAENLHITLIFIGSASNEELMEILQLAKKTAQNHSPFSVQLEKICYGPPEIFPPRMIWVVGKNSPEFALLKEDLDKMFLGAGRFRFVKENRKFSPHITLARVRQWEWRKIEPEERPAIEEQINLIFPAESIEVMESRLRRQGSEYAILGSFPLGKEKI